MFLLSYVLYGACICCLKMSEQITKQKTSKSITITTGRSRGGQRQRAAAFVPFAIASMFFLSRVRPSTFALHHRSASVVAVN
jgi:hypothetical protein